MILENTDFDLAVNQPYFKFLIQKGALLENYNALIRESQPNYVALMAGSTFGITNQPVNLNIRHLGDLLEEKGKSWKNYAEDFPGNCFLGNLAGHYARRHVPFLSFKNIQDNPERCSRVVNAGELQKDLEAKILPHFSLYIPNNQNNGHDTGIGFADRWLSTFVSPLLTNKELMKDTLLIITFDEPSVGGGRGNRVATVLLGAGIQTGAVSRQDYDHYCLLRTFEELFELPSLKRYDESAPPIDDIWIRGD